MAIVITTATVGNGASPRRPVRVAPVPRDGEAGAVPHASCHVVARPLRLQRRTSC